MKFIDKILQAPSYGWATTTGELAKPSNTQLFKEALSRINVFRCRKNWISALTIFMIVSMLPFLFLFITRFFSWPLLLLTILYSMMVMGVQGTVWFHRYCTHKSYNFSSPVWRFITQHLDIKTLAEEIYVVSHHVHHSKSDQPGDPYNSTGGLWYCMLAEFNHQRVAAQLNEGDYSKLQKFMQHTGVRLNSYQQYRKWDSVAHPLYTVCTWLFNWAFWYGVFFLLGGHALACALFSGALLWFVLVRAFNYTGHAKGDHKHVDGLDFDRSNLSVNQARPGMLTGEWHNNHHLYPGSACAGFLKNQFDPAWVMIFGMYKLGMVKSYHDSKKEFLKRYVQPSVGADSHHGI